MIKRKKTWFDIGTAIWAIALLVTALIYVGSSPAFAGGEDLDCYLACEVECEEDGGCDDYWEGRSGCYVGCREGVSRYLPC